jgi:hypothetical protein
MVARYPKSLEQTAKPYSSAQQAMPTLWLQQFDVASTTRHCASVLVLQAVNALPAGGVGNIAHNSPLSSIAKYSTCHTTASEVEVANKNAYLEIF